MRKRHQETYYIHTYYVAVVVAIEPIESEKVTAAAETAHKTENKNLEKKKIYFTKKFA